MKSRQHGTVPDEGVSKEVAQVLYSLGQSNLMDRGLHLGDPVDGGLVGKFDSVYAVVSALPASATNLVVPHSLGRIPKSVVLWELETGPTGDSMVAVTSVNKNAWTETTLQIRVAPSSGTMTGAKLTLLVS